MTETEIAHWNSTGGGSTNLEILPGNYRLDGGTVAHLTLTEVEGRTPAGFPVVETEEHVGEPLDADGFTVTEAHRLHRLAWGRGHIVLSRTS